MLRAFFESNFNLLLIATLFLGLLVPGGERLPDCLILILLTITIYISCFRLSIHDLRDVQWKSALIFVFARFIAFPILLFCMVNPFLPEYSFIALVFALLPAGVSSPAMTAMYGGNVTLAFITVVVTTMAAPFTIPGLLKLTVDKSFEFDLFGLFLTLSLIIAIPFMLFLVTRLSTTIVNTVERHGKLVSMISIILIGPTAIAKQQSVILAAPGLLFKLCAAALTLYLLIFSGSWLAGRKQKLKDRISQTASSCFNNTGLGIGAALLYLTPQAVLFFVVCEIPWVLMPVVMTLVLKRHKSAEVSS